MKIDLPNYKILFFAGFFCLPFLSIGQTWDEIIKLTASDAAAGDNFGIDVSISGDKAVVGAYFEGGSFSGAAYVFEIEDGTWTETQKLTASDAAAGDNFGLDVSISVDRLIVGSLYDDDDGSNSGSAYIFDLEGDTWTETQKITAMDGAAGDLFGRSVSISGDRVLVGAYYNDDDGSSSGSAYVFGLEGDTWIETQELHASDAASGDEFGRMVAIDGERAIITSHQDDDAGENSGSAYIFDLVGITWTETQKITASDAALGDRFGGSVALSGDFAIVGAYANDDGGSNSGSAYIFELDGTWTETQKLTASDPAAGDEFGGFVSISGEKVIVGSFRDDDDGTNSGSAYIFELEADTWIEIQKLTASDAAAGDQFGYGAAISDNRVIIGARGNADDGSGSGSAYIFEVCSMPPEVIATADDIEVCLGDEIVLTGGGAITYTWGGDVTDGVAFTPELGTSTFTVIGTDDEGCENMASIDIIVNPLPAVTATADESEVCLGDEITLTGEGATSYEWDGGATDGIPFAPGLGITTFTVIGTDDAECENTASIDITVNPVPDVTATADDTEICLGDEITLIGGGADTYTWDGGATDGVAFTPELGTTTFTVTGTNDFDCENTSSIDIAIYEAIAITYVASDELFGGDASINITVTGGNPVYSFDWDDDGAGDFDDDEDLTDILAGTYIVLVEDEAGCSGTETIVVDSKVGIDELSASGIAVFPNPTLDKVTIQLDGELIYRLVSINGKVLFTAKTVNQAFLDLSELADGIYFLEILPTAIGTENGSEIVKVVKQ